MMCDADGRPLSGFGLVAILTTFLAVNGLIAGSRSPETEPSSSVQPSSGQQQDPDDRLPWLDIRSARLSMRYQYVETEGGLALRDHLQHREWFQLGVPFDRGGHFGIQSTIGSGTNFNGSWSNLGVGSKASGDFNVRELYLSLRPVSGLAVEWGGISPIRGAATEITTYDNDAFLMGGRVTVSDRDRFFFDTISGTVAYLGDLREPNVFKRFDRWDQSNYQQFLVARQFGGRALVSADYTSQWGVVTLRQAVNLKAPELRIVDSVRFENYQRVEGNKGYGFALQGEKGVPAGITLSGGFASIDPDYGLLNGDRFGFGERFFLGARIPLGYGFSADLFIQQAASNSSNPLNDLRFDAILNYDVLRGLKAFGIY